MQNNWLSSNILQKIDVKIREKDTEKSGSMWLWKRDCENNTCQNSQHIL